MKKIIEKSIKDLVEDFKKNPNNLFNSKEDIISLLYHKIKLNIINENITLKINQPTFNDYSEINRYIEQRIGKFFDLSIIENIKQNKFRRNFREILPEVAFEFRFNYEIQNKNMMKHCETSFIKLQDKKNGVKSKYLIFINSKNIKEKSNYEKIIKQYKEYIQKMKLKYPDVKAIFVHYIYYKDKENETIIDKLLFESEDSINLGFKQNTFDDYIHTMEKKNERI